MKARTLTIVTKLFLFIAVFFLPIKTSISNIGIIGLIVTSIFSFIIYGADFNKSNLKKFFYFSTFTLIVPVLLGSIYTSLPGEALDEIFKYIFLLLLPILLFRKDLSELYFETLLKKSLIAGCFISGIFLLSYTFYDFFLIRDLPIIKLFSSHITGFSFLEPIGGRLHPIYVGSYFATALSFLLFSELKVHKAFKVIIVLIYISSIVFMNSRIIFFSLFVIFILFSLTKLPLKTFFLSLALLVVGLIIVFPFIEKTYIFNKAINGTVWDLKNNVGTPNTAESITSDSRMSRWIVGWELFTEKPLLGYGTGVEKEVLLKAFKKNEMSRSVSQGYNAHNQMLSYLIRFGLFGLFFMIAFFIGNSYMAFNHKDIVYISFLIFMLAIFSVENFIDSNMGINILVLLNANFLLKTKYA